MNQTTSEILRDIRAYEGELTVIFPLIRIYGRQETEVALNDLRLVRLVRLVAISDYRDATEDELADSIEGVEETLFYVKAI